MQEIKLSNNYNVQDYNIIKERFLSRLKEYNINFQSKDIIALDIMINALLNKDLDRTNTIYVINANCGIGKSVLLEEYVTYMKEKHKHEYGCVIAKERIDDINKMVSKDPSTRYGLYGFQLGDCSKGYQSYNPNRCRVCTDLNCRIKNNSVEAKTKQILITTHQRIQLADSYPYIHNQLTDYAVLDKETQKSSNVPIEYKRRDLFIDENPSFYELNSITPISIDIFANELNYLYRRNCKNKAKLINYFSPYLHKLKEIISKQQDMYFNGFINKDNYKEFTKHEEQFKSNYYGNYFVECLNVLNVIKYGGKHSNSKIVFPTYRALNKLPFTSIIVFDATANINQTYEYNCKLIKVPETRLFNGVSIYWCKNNNLTKNYYREHEDFPLKIAELIKEESKNHDKTLLVTFKDLENTYKELLKEEIENGKIVLDHVNNTKGKNNYSDCTCLWVLYNLYKGDDFYLFAKRNELDTEDLNDIVFNTKDKVRTAFTYTNTDEQGNAIFKINQSIDSFIATDKAKDIVQELFRIALRKYNFNDTTKIYLFNTDERVLYTVMEFLPESQLIEWTPFEKEKKSPQLKQYIEAVFSEFSNAESGHSISLIEFRNKYHINEKGFRRYQKLTEIELIHNELKIKRKGNFFVVE